MRVTIELQKYYIAETLQLMIPLSDDPLHKFSQKYKIKVYVLPQTHTIFAP